MVLPTITEIAAIADTYRELFPDAWVNSLITTIGWNTTGELEEKKAYANCIKGQLDSRLNYESRELYKEEWYSMNGGFLFLGIFLGLLFTIGTVLITYFKQVSEDFDDRAKFQIMQKVGLYQRMIQKSTRSQIIWMFLLPIVTASIHIAFAYPIVQKLLIIFGITNQQMLITSIIGVIMAFSLVYWLIYRVTSKVYYTIVK